LLAKSSNCLLANIVRFNAPRICWKLHKDERDFGILYGSLQHFQEGNWTCWLTIFWREKACEKWERQFSKFWKNILNIELELLNCLSLTVKQNIHKMQFLPIHIEV